MASVIENASPDRATCQLAAETAEIARIISVFDVRPIIRSGINKRLARQPNAPHFWPKTAPRFPKLGECCRFASMDPKRVNRITHDRHHAVMATPLRRRRLTCRI